MLTHVPPGVAEAERAQFMSHHFCALTVTGE